MKRKLILIIMLLLLWFVAFGFGQSTDIVDSILEQEKVLFAPAAYMVLAASGEAEESLDLEDVVSTLENMGWNYSGKSGEEPIRLGEYSYLIMKAFDIPGGIFYSLFPGPRYAARELVHRSFVTGDLSYLRNLSGEEALRILGRVLEWKGARS